MSTKPGADPYDVVPLSELSVEDRGALRDTAELVDQYGDDLAGSYWDEGSESVILVASSEEGLRLAETSLPKGSSVVIVMGGIALNDLSSMSLDIEEAIGPTVDTWGFDPLPDGSGIAVLADSPPEGLGRDLQDKFGVVVEVIDAPVEKTFLTDSRDVDTSPFAAGLRFGVYNGNNVYQGQCSGSFGVKDSGNELMLTAGHCYPDNHNPDRAWVYDWQNNERVRIDRLGTWNGNSTMRYPGGSFKLNDDEFHGDISRINVTTNGGSIQPKMWTGGQYTNQKDTVVRRLTPQVGDSVCYSAFRTGTNCQLEIVKTNVNRDFDWGDGTIGTWRNIDIATSSNANGCPQPGDSGGAVYRRIEGYIWAIGVVAGSGLGDDGNCRMYFTGMEESIQAWGGSLIEN